MQSERDRRDRSLASPDRTKPFQKKRIGRKKTAKKPTKQTATSKRGAKFKRSPTSKTGWVAVKPYTRTYPRRKATEAEQEVSSCAHTRRKKRKAKKNKKGKWV